MSAAIITVIYGVPLTHEISKKLGEWEEQDDERWFETNSGLSGFNVLYSGCGDMFVGFCGKELDELKTYTPQMVGEVRLQPSKDEMVEASAMVEALDPELKALAGEIGVYFIWSDN